MADRIGIPSDMIREILGETDDDDDVVYYSTHIYVSSHNNYTQEKTVFNNSLV